MLPSKKNRYTQFDDGNSEQIHNENELSSNDKDNNDNTDHKSSHELATFEIIDRTDISADYTQKASIGEPKRLIHIWLRVMLITFYLVLSIGTIYVVADSDITNGLIITTLLITIVIPTILIMFILIKPKCMPFTSYILLMVVVILRAIQWILSIIYLISVKVHFRNYLFAILGALLNECGFLCIVTEDFYVFYVKRDYDNAVFSVHYNPQRAIRLISGLLCISSILWFIYCYGALGEQTKYIDTWFYLLLGIAAVMFLIFEYILDPIWGNKIGFILCCIVILLILFIWGDDQLLSFSDLATAAILPQLMCLSFAYFKKFAAECM
eukprot:148614_1